MVLPIGFTAGTQPPNSQDSQAGHMATMATTYPALVPRGVLVPAAPRTASPVVFDAAAASIRGPRAENQDAACAGTHLLAVADGVGGKPGGGVAADCVIRTLSQAYEERTEDAVAALRSAVAAANQGLTAVTSRRPELAGMATTLTAAVLAPGGRVVLAHVGDTRAYLLRRGVLRPLTTDHTFVQGLLDAGVIDADQARRHPLRSLVLRTLQGRQDDVADVSVHPVRLGDRLLVCSDGLSGVVPPDVLARELAEESRPKAAAHRLLRAALAAGTGDDVTAAVADVAGVGDLQATGLSVRGAQ
jgi:PPM family protein phosphatase